MAFAITRVKTDLIGTPGSPATIAAAATNTSTALDMTIAGADSAVISLTLTAGSSAPTSAVIIRNSYSTDGTNYTQDGPDIVLTMANSGIYPYRYDPPDAAWKAQVVVINGATNGITAWCQGSVKTVSV